jgi:nucleoid DNA-binding protein
MKTDSVNVQITKDVTQAVNKKYKGKLKRTLTNEEIFAIVDYQYVRAAQAILNKEFIELPMFGRFFVKEGRDKYIEPGKRFYEPHMTNDSQSTTYDDSNPDSSNI